MEYTPIMSNAMHFVTMLAYLTFAAIGAYLAWTERLRLSRFFLIVAVLLFVPWLFDELYIIFVNMHKLLQLRFY